MAQATTIDGVIEELDKIIEKARKDQNRAGYFPALYRKVTVAVKEGIAANVFEDGARMEKLDVVFANRYLAAYDQFYSGEVPTRSWLIAFEAAGSRWPIVLQHLLLGMNAHINLDLGIAAARTSPGGDLPGLRNDFNKINEVLASLVDGVKGELNTVWPHLAFWDRLAGHSEDVIINFSMGKARNHAWDIAEKLAPLPPSEQVSTIKEIDHWTAAFGRLLWKPTPMVRLGNLIIRLHERGSVDEIITLLL